MEPWVWALIAAFVVIDALVTFLVVRGARRRRRAAGEQPDETDELARRIGLD